MDERFHPAQTALATGDFEVLASLLAADRDLAMARSEHSHPTLLQCLVLTTTPVDTLEELIDLLAAHGAELTDPLIAASSMNNVRAVTKLLDLGADIEGNGKWSPLEEALYWGHAAPVWLLLERGATIKNLRIAAGLGDREAVDRCFDDSGALTAAAGEVAWPFFRVPIPEPVRRDPQQILGNALVYAAAWGRSEVVTDLINRGARINLIPAGFDYAGTALHYAALEGKREMVDQLLQMGADPAVRDTKIAKHPEDWADHGGHKELAEHLRQIRQSKFHDRWQHGNMCVASDPQGTLASDQTEWEPSVSTDPSGVSDADSPPLACRRCGRELYPGRGELYVVSILAVADPSPPIFTEDDLPDDIGAEILRLTAQLNRLSAEQAQDQVYRRLFFHLCPSCYRHWIEDPTGSLF